MESFSKSDASENAARVIAFYLPQFHPIPENNEWWGNGFTEWNNVAKAKPRYRGHYQPRLPADLGFYDLRVPETREAQADLARSHGVEGFCYWHYWFGDGRRILERPFAEVLESGRPDFPFCMAWANQTWSGIWHGNPGRTLIEQSYPGRDDERAHFQMMLPAFRDPRYITVDGKPLFVVYAPTELPDPTAFISHWRQLAAESGLKGLHFVAMANDIHNDKYTAFDSILSHPPVDYIFSRKRSFVADIKRLINERNFGARINGWIGDGLRLPRRFDYSDVVREARTLMPEGPRYLPCVLPNWDNTPRSGARGFVLENTTPALFREYLKIAIGKVASHAPDHRIVFVKAWNEWAEGNHLEPDVRFGRGFLEVIKQEVAP